MIASDEGGCYPFTVEGFKDDRMDVSQNVDGCRSPRRGVYPIPFDPPCVCPPMCRKRQRKLLTAASEAVSTSTAVNASGLQVRSLRREEEASEDD